MNPERKSRWFIIWAKTSPTTNAVILPWKRPTVLWCGQHRVWAATCVSYNSVNFPKDPLKYLFGLHCREDWPVSICCWPNLILLMSLRNKWKCSHRRPCQEPSWSILADDISISRWIQLNIEPGEEHSNWHVYFHGPVNIHGDGIGPFWFLQ